METCEECVLSGTPQQNGKTAQEWAARKLRSLGMIVRAMHYNCPFDLLVGSLRVEVKYARPNAMWQWTVNLHTHGGLDESQKDAYLFILDGIPGNKKMPLYLVLPAPQRVTTIVMSFSSLVRDYAQYVDNWQLLGGIKNKSS